MKNAKPALSASPNALKAYFLASRPKTWIASISPVLIGTAIAPHRGKITFALTLLFSLCIQIGTNYANDYFDFMKGADTVLRKGPKRATSEGWIRPDAMLRASLLTFSCALIFALPLMFKAGLWSFFFASGCVFFGLLYTGGKKPLGYLGLGEALVFPFFGPIACCGAYFLQTFSISWYVLFASLAPAAFSCALLAANNLRDEISDRIANKNTLVVRWGKTFGAIEYTLFILLAALTPWILVFGFHANPKLLLASSAALLAAPSIKKVFSFRDPLELIPVLANTSFAFIAYTFLFYFFRK